MPLVTGTVNFPIPVAQGGTGSSTASAAVDTLGGASSTGTGGIVRKNSPSLLTPTIDSFTTTAQPRVFVYRTAVQSINNATSTAISFPTGSATERFDVGPMHSLSSNDSRITIPSGQGGVYLIGGSLLFTANALGVRVIWFQVNGAGQYGDQSSLSNSASIPAYLNTTTFLDLSAGDYIELIAFQNSTGALDVGSAGGTEGSSFWATRIG